MIKKSNKNLLDESLDQVLTEVAGSSMFGGAAGGSPGQFNHTSRSNAKTWSPESPPYRNITGSAPGYNIKDIAEEEEEKVLKSAKRLPFPLDQVNDFLVNSYVELEKAEAQIRTCLQYNITIKSKRAKYALLLRIQKKMKILKHQIKDISDDIDKVSFT